MITSTRMLRRDKGQRQGEVATETIGMAKVMTCEDYSNLQRLLRVIALVLQFVKLLKLGLQTNVETQKELTSQDIAVAETLFEQEP